MEDDQIRNAMGLIGGIVDESINGMPDHIAAPVRAVTDFRKTLNQESDRGCALMAAAYLDERLGDLLKSFFVHNDKVINKMFDFNGPFGTFSSRIDSAYALGLLPENVRKDIHLVRKIRNDFAHVSKPITFNDEPMASRCNELYIHGKDNDSRARGKFTRSMMTAVGVIEVSILQLTKCTPMEDHDISLNQKGIDALRNFLKENGLQELVELVR
jgi:hypothetical protein